MQHDPFLCMALTNLVVTKSELIHINAGIIRCIELVLPDASIVNARFPAACGMRLTTAMRIHDLVLGLLARAAPGLAPAGGSGAVVITYISTSELGETGRVVWPIRFRVARVGVRRRTGSRGLNCRWCPANVPVEVLESEAPVLVRRFGLRPDTEGAGEHRGGFGSDTICRSGIRPRWW